MIENHNFFSAVILPRNDMKYRKSNLYVTRYIFLSNYLKASSYSVSYYLKWNSMTRQIQAVESIREYNSFYTEHFIEFLMHSQPL